MLRHLPSASFTMLAITAWVCSAGSKLREVSWRKAAMTVFWSPVRTIRPVSGSFIRVSATFFSNQARVRANGPVVGLDDARIAADECGERDRFRGREGEVAAGAVLAFAVLAHAPELAPGPVRHDAFEHPPESVRIDRPLEPGLGRA